MLSDLPTNLTPGWQAVDMSIRCLRTALRSEDFQKAPEVVATVSSVQNVLSKILSAYTSGTTSSGGDSAGQGSTDEGNPSSSADADSMPPASESSSDSSGGDGGEG
jgi:putative IMPACT (imprinted ancient) family translation regulator